MHVKMVIIPSDDGLDVLIWARWKAGSMRVRHFKSRTELVSVLVSLNLISAKEAGDLESFVFTGSCPLFSGQIDEEILEHHDFNLA